MVGRPFYSISPLPPPPPASPPPAVPHSPPASAWLPQCTPPVPHPASPAGLREAVREPHHCSGTIVLQPDLQVVPGAAAVEQVPYFLTVDLHHRQPHLQSSPPPQHHREVSNPNATVYHSSTTYTPPLHFPTPAPSSSMTHCCSIATANPSPPAMPAAAA